MTYAYNDLYLNDAQTSLAVLIDYSINDCKKTPEYITYIFTGQVSELFEIGDPRTIAGMSGVELAREIMLKANPTEKFPDQSISNGYRKEYWAGWALAYYQWYTGKRFKRIFERIPLREIISMYNVYHEMDISNFVEEMDKRYDSVILPTKLREFREYRGISQQKLSEISGVSLRSIQLYEQRVNDIDKAQAHTLYKLSRALYCEIEDLLESPEKVH